MKILRLFAAVSALFFCAQVALAQGLDSLAKRQLSGRLDEYLAAIETSGVDVQKEEADFLIGSASDPFVRQFVAVKVYNHYFTSKVMGAEAVAIHVLDKWFLDGDVKMYDDIDLLNARVFADFNRQSLIGQKAPSLELTTLQGERVNLFSVSPEKLSVLYFYDTDCATCKLETMFLNEALAKESFPLTFYAVYAGDNKEHWEKYVSENFQFSEIPVVHLWDPYLDSDFQRKYGVLQTPRLFLIAPDGTILGRSLDTRSLMQMLDSMLQDKPLEYNSPKSVELFDSILGDEPSVQDIEFTATLLESSTLAKGDVRMYKQLIGDYLYYLSSKRGEAYKEALTPFIDMYILERLDVWNTDDDKMRVVGFAEILKDLLSKSKPGSDISDVKVPGLLLKKGKAVVKTMNLRKLRGNVNFVIFHTEGCHICEAEIKAAHALSGSRKDVQIFLVNVDEVISSSPALSSRLFDSFDLSSLPFIVQVDKKGKIIRRYISML